MILNLNPTGNLNMMRIIKAFVGFWVGDVWNTKLPLKIVKFTTPMVAVIIATYRIITLLRVYTTADI